MEEKPGLKTDAKRSSPNSVVSMFAEISEGSIQGRDQGLRKEEVRSG